MSMNIELHIHQCEQLDIVERTSGAFRWYELRARDRNGTVYSIANLFTSLAGEQFLLPRLVYLNDDPELGETLRTILRERC